MAGRKGIDARYVSHTARTTGLAVEAVSEGLWTGGQLMIAAATPDVPIETGTLGRSAVVSQKLPSMGQVYQAAMAGKMGLDMYKPPKLTGYTSRKGRVGSSIQGLINMFVSYNTPYAAWLHENPDWKPRDWKYLDTGKRPRPKTPKPAVGRQKYLENAAKRIRPRIPACIAQAFRKRGF